jgi:hypothetical protein
VLAAGSAPATTEAEDIDGGPPGGAAGISDSGHHWSPSGIHEVPEMKVREVPELEIRECSTYGVQPWTGQ